MALTVLGCNDDPTEAQIQNAYPKVADWVAGETMTVLKTWWVTTLFPTPIPPGATSGVERTIPGSDFAFVLLAPGRSPDGAGGPSRVVALKSERKLAATEHKVLTIVVSDQQFGGNCDAGKPHPHISTWR